jgi:hypothetical protein
MSIGWIKQVANIPERPPITNGWIISNTLDIVDEGGGGVGLEEGLEERFGWG